MPDKSKSHQLRVWFVFYTSHLSGNVPQTFCTHRLIRIIRKVMLLIVTEPELPVSEVPELEHRASNCTLR